MNKKIDKDKKCGLIMPISEIDNCTESHWEEVRLIIKEALAETEFTVELVSDGNDVGIIQKRIVQNIYDNEIVICDVSAKNPNVMFELGMRLAFDKPTIIIKDNKTNYSFDTGQIEHIEYPRELHYHEINAFKLKLRNKVIDTYEASKSPDYTTFLKHFGQFVVAKIEEKHVGKDEYLLQSLSDLRSEVKTIAIALNGLYRPSSASVWDELIDSGANQNKSNSKIWWAASMLGGASRERLEALKKLENSAAIAPTAFDSTDK